MEQTGSRRPSGQKKVVSRADSVLIMAVAAIAAAATTFLTVAGIIATFTGPVTLTLPALVPAKPHRAGTGIHRAVYRHGSNHPCPSFG